jgi:hypothetical protein
MHVRVAPENSPWDIASPITRVGTSKTQGIPFWPFWSWPSDWKEVVHARALFSFENNLVFTLRAILEQLFKANELGQMHLVRHTSVQVQCTYYWVGFPCEENFD